MGSQLSTFVRAPIDCALDGMVEEVQAIHLSDSLQESPKKKVALALKPISITFASVVGEFLQPLPTPLTPGPPMPGAFFPRAALPSFEEPSPVSAASSSKAQALFHAKLKASDANPTLDLTTSPLRSRNGLPPTPPTLISELASPTSTLADTDTEREFEVPFFFKPQLKAAVDSAEKLALKQQLKLAIPPTPDHANSFNGKLDEPAQVGSPFLQKPILSTTAQPATPATRQRRNSIPSSPYDYISGIDSPIDTPDRLLFGALDTGLTRWTNETPNDPFPETPDSAVYPHRNEPIAMTGPLDDDDGYISDPGSAVVRCFAEPLRAGPQIHRGKQLPFPKKPTKPIPTSPTKRDQGAVNLRESRSARFATLKRRYHDVPTKYGIESPIRSPMGSPIRSPIKRALFSPVRSPLPMRSPGFLPSPGLRSPSDQFPPIGSPVDIRSPLRAPNMKKPGISLLQGMSKMQPSSPKVSSPLATSPVYSFA